MNNSTVSEGNGIVIVGGGLAGLTAATFLARAGQSVTVFEKTHEVGGRAITHKYGEFLFNQGPHALYRGGNGLKVLQELGIPFTGRKPALSASLIYQDKVEQLPGGLFSFLSSDVFGKGGKLALTRFIAMLTVLKPQSVAHLSIQEWIEREFHQPEMHNFLLTLARVSTYANAPETQSASVFISQMQAVLKSNVYYLDGGWQTLVEGLRQAALARGVKIVTESRVEAIVQDGPTQVSGVRLADGTFCPASAVIMAANGPTQAMSLLDGPAQTVLQEWADRMLPVRAACLDIGLRHLPKPDTLVAFGLDQPLYFSVHSAWAKLGPREGAVIHVAKYLHPTNPTDPKADEQELEHTLDLLQPGWRSEVVERRFLPKMMVYNAVVTAEQGGFAGRPGPQVPGLANLYVAGDWVGPVGILADGTLSSARQAANLILSQLAAKPELELASR